MILTIRTDKPESEIGLFDGQKQIKYETWQAHRQLAETINTKIQEIVGDEQITGIVVYQGPGSFTGLRIGMSVANALAYSLDIPITATTGDDWAQTGIKDLEENPSRLPVAPDYGSPANITTPRK